MTPKGMTRAQVTVAFQETEKAASEGTKFATADERLEAIRKAWAEKCGQEYVPRELPPPADIGPLKTVEEDAEEDAPKSRRGKRLRGL